MKRTKVFLAQMPWVLLLAITLCSCSKSSVPSKVPVITGAELKSRLNDDDGSGADTICTDETYQVLPESWVTNTFCQSWKLWFPKYLSAARGDDCDDFSRAGAFYANYLWRTTNPTYTPEGQGITFGEFYYPPDTGGGHAICVAYVTRGTNIIRIYIEPQTGELKELSLWEETSCYIRKF